MKHLYPDFNRKSTLLSRFLSGRLITGVILFTNIILLYNARLLAQSPIIEWDRRFGGSGSDGMYSVQQTKDGGYILGGDSDSPISGDKTQGSWGGTDYWIIKTDKNGIKQWDKRFGGSGTEQFYSVQQTTDGGYFLAGWSNSGASGGDSPRRFFEPTENPAPAKRTTSPRSNCRRRKWSSWVIIS